MGVTVHGGCVGGPSKLYYVWKEMKRRCTYSGHPRFADYGGRGITVCARWLSSFTAFVQDMGECPEGMTLEREDNDGNYCPENCRWADYTAQSRNRRSARVLTVQNQAIRLTDAAVLYNLTVSTIANRLRNGWSDERACLTPAGRQGKRK